jgi:hypothetical protein
MWACKCSDHRPLRPPAEPLVHTVAVATAGAVGMVAIMENAFISGMAAAGLATTARFHTVV